MFKAILKTQWKWTQGAVLLCTIGAFALPILSLSYASQSLNPRGFIAAMRAWGVAYAAGAALLGLIVAMLAWSSDHRGHHVYALALPIPRWRYVLLRFGAGVVFLAPPVIAVAISALLVSRSTRIPAGLHAYPLALTLRFAFSALVAFAIFFALSAATRRAAYYIIGAIGLIVTAQVLADAAGLQNAYIISYALDFVFASPGLLSVFSGRWTLIDV